MRQASSLGLGLAIMLLTFFHLSFAQAESTRIASPFSYHGELFNEPSDYILHPVPREDYRTRLARLVETASRGNAILVDIFEGPAGLTGVIVKGNSETGKLSLGWVPPGGRLLFMGSVWDNQGSNLTEVAVNAFLSSAHPGQAIKPDGSPVNTPIPTVDSGALAPIGTKAHLDVVPRVQGEPTTPEKIHKAALQLPGIMQFKQGQPNGTIVVFYSTTCGYCRRLKRAFDSKADLCQSNKVQVLWLPILANDTARTQGAIELEHGFDSAIRPRPGYQIPKRYQDILVVSTKLYLEATQGREDAPTPMIFAPEEAGVRTYLGAPQAADLERIIKAAGGVK